MVGGAVLRALPRSGSFLFIVEEGLYVQWCTSGFRARRLVSWVIALPACTVFGVQQRLLSEVISFSDVAD